MESRSCILGNLIKNGMADLSIFESRKAILSCTPETFYNFITDMRNFRRFIPSSVDTGWEASRGSCSVNMAPVGEVKLVLSEKREYSEVLFEGTSAQVSRFFIRISFGAVDGAKAEAVVRLEAELNPIVKMIASRPLSDLLETMCREMEKTENWEGEEFR